MCSVNKPCYGTTSAASPSRGLASLLGNLQVPTHRTPHISPDKTPKCLEVCLCISEEGNALGFSSPPWSQGPEACPCIFSPGRSPRNGNFVQAPAWIPFSARTDLKAWWNILLQWRIKPRILQSISSGSSRSSLTFSPKEGDRGNMVYMSMLLFFSFKLTRSPSLSPLYCSILLQQSIKQLLSFNPKAAVI